jgi:hypothetical protein
MITPLPLAGGAGGVHVPQMFRFVLPDSSHPNPSPEEEGLSL